MTAPDGPLRLTPMPVGRPWGGGRFGVVDGEPIGELWVSGDGAVLPDGRTIGSTGLASHVPLVKVLDIRGTLSVQVHPDDRAAVELRGTDAVGKHECWVVLEAPAEATVALGLAPGASADDLFSGDERRVDAALRIWPVAPGTIVDIAPGTVHAPGGGLVLYEVQQRSDLTFRIWDWGRSRPLHLSEARRCLRPEAAPRVGVIPTETGPVTVSAPEAPFRLDACHLADRGAPAELELSAPTILSVTAGSLEIAARSTGGSAVPPDPGASDGAGPSGRSIVPLEAGSHWLVPAGRWVLGGSGDALLASVRPTATSADASVET